jgi:hypothetical protein
MYDPAAREHPMAVIKASAWQFNCNDKLFEYPLSVSGTEMVRQRNEPVLARTELINNYAARPGQSQ